MASAPLPVEVSLVPFFVLVWDHEGEEMVLHLADQQTSYSLGNDFPKIAGRMSQWGLERDYADRCVDAAREFRAVQCIPEQDRIINLFQRDYARDIVAQQFAEIERDETRSYAHP